MRLIRWLSMIILMSAAASSPAGAETVVAGLSDTRVEIRSNFVGADLLLFGVVEPDEFQEDAPDGYDVVVVVRGPVENMVTRRRERVGGIWVNRDSVTFEDAPNYYAALGSRPFAEITTPENLLDYQIGLENFRLAAVDEADAAKVAEFREALVRRKAAQFLYIQDERGVDMLTGSLFSTRIPLPAHIRPGAYNARILVYANGELITTQRETFWVAKSGFEARVFNWSERRPFLYGLGAVAIALFAGWFAGVIFRRD
jgi:uncharacterized protein (TIGR02186 family)